MQRLDALNTWIARQFPRDDWTLQPASADASFRRYFRLHLGNSDTTRILMDAPPQTEDCRPFIRVAALMRDAGLNVPEVLAQDLSQGFLLLTDLGATTYLAALRDDAGAADDLFRDAIRALLRWQLASRAGVLPAYDAALLRRELELFPDWYLARHLQLPLQPGQSQQLQEMFALILARNLAQPSVYVHRDYMPRNLMLSAPNPGVLDFQDAVYGPISYDIASLLRDAFISWEPEQEREWARRYWEFALDARLPVRADFADFYRDLEWMGLQRHLKVLGIFARIRYRDGKPGYIEDAPRFLRYVRDVTRRYAELAPLARLLDTFEAEQARRGGRFP